MLTCYVVFIVIIDEFGSLLYTYQKVMIKYPSKNSLVCQTNSLKLIESRVSRQRQRILGVFGWKSQINYSQDSCELIAYGSTANGQSVDQFRSDVVCTLCVSLVG